MRDSARARSILDDSKTLRGEAESAYLFMAGGNRSRGLEAMRDVAETARHLAEDAAAFVKDLEKRGRAYVNGRNYYGEPLPKCLWRGQEIDHSWREEYDPGQKQGGVRPSVCTRCGIRSVTDSSD